MKLYRKYKSFIQLMLPYLVILAISLSVTLIAHLHIINLMNEEISRLGNQILSLFSKEIDKDFARIDRAVQLFLDNPNVRWLGGATAFSNNEALRAYRLQEEIKTVFRSVDDIALSVFLYFPAYDLIVTDGTAYRSSEQFYRNHYSSGDGTYNELLYQRWKQQLTQAGIQQQISASPEFDGFYSENTMAIIKMMPYRLFYDYNPVAVFTLDISALASRLDANMTETSYQLVMYHREDNSPIFSTLGEPETLKLIQEHRLRGYLVSEFESGHSQVGYLLCADNASFVLSAETFARIMFYAAIFTAMFEILLPMVFSFRQLSPIRQLLGAVQSLSGKPETMAVAGELKKLEVVFHTLIEEHSDYARTLEHQREVLLEIFLLRIINNGYTDERDIRDMADILGLSLDKAMFLSVRFAFRVTDEELLYRTDFGQISDTIMGEYPNAIMFTQKGRNELLLILSYDSTWEYEDFVRGDIGRISARIASLSHQEATAHAGVPVPLLKELHRSYASTFGARADRADQSGIDWPGDAGLSEYRYTIENELTLMHLVKSGKAIEVEALLRKLVAFAVGHSVVQELLFGLHATFQRIVGYNADTKEPVSLRLNYTDSGMTEEKIGYVIHAYINLTKSYQSEAQPDNREDQIVAYLAANYRDQQLSLNTLSDTFSASNNYLSKLFKRKTGTRFSDYLEKLRRAFKKVHGFTPSELRADSSTILTVSEREISCEYKNTEQGYH